MNIESLIIKRLRFKKRLTVADIVKETGFSRAYIHTFFQKLRDRGTLVLVGKANNAHYIQAGKRNAHVPTSLYAIRRILINKNLSEDDVLQDIKKATDIFLRAPKHIADITAYAFTEMLNNAIEHSRSKKIEIRFSRGVSAIRFDVIDWGVGIFSNIMKKKKLKNELEAIQDLTKGKQTTAPKAHTGEGIFFTSKAGDTLTIRGSSKKLIFNTVLDDVFIKDAKHIRGTRVSFMIGLRSKKNLNTIFRAYSGSAFTFSKTKVTIKLFKIGTEYISRSQARRVMSGLDKFRTVVLDFKGVDTVGQAFTDEIFRVWKHAHPHKKIEYAHANENVAFMIKRSAVSLS
ncbi:MAG: DUF4325 domain-containing protein [Candidatus Niyogibacteria bacterium]|nr:DUF4325 domain-containing protein [Candidatus Niyogibacteria bacterium]